MEASTDAVRLSLGVLDSVGPSDAQPTAGFLGEAFTIGFCAALAKGALWLHTREHGAASSRGPTARWDVTGEQQAEPGQCQVAPVHSASEPRNRSRERCEWCRKASPGSLPR